MTYPKEVIITEVAPRDGLQNEARYVLASKKIAFINLLSETGLKNIEATSFVSPKAIPQLADGLEVFQKIKKKKDCSYSALVPNQTGMYQALEAGVREIALFTAASETFNQRNINCSIAQSITRFEPVIKLAREHNIKIRAYISCATSCPYEGSIKASKVVEIIGNLLELQVDEIVLGDTIGTATVKQVRHLLDKALGIIPISKLGLHFHDTYGQAIANINAALEYGIYRFDSAVAGLGGCPYARGASGNVATEDVLYLMHGLGINTGIDIFAMVRAGELICKILGKKNQSKVANALLALEN